MADEVPTVPLTQRVRAEYDEAVDRLNKCRDDSRAKFVDPEVACSALFMAVQLKRHNYMTYRPQFR